jgi:hypothetical protein
MDGYPGCSSNCRKYKRAKKENQKRKKYMREDNNFGDYMKGHDRKKERKSSKNKW